MKFEIEMEGEREKARTGETGTETESSLRQNGRMTQTSDSSQSSESVTKIPGRVKQLLGYFPWMCLAMVSTGLVLILEPFAPSLSFVPDSSGSAEDARHVWYTYGEWCEADKLQIVKAQSSMSRPRPFPLAFREEILAKQAASNKEEYSFKIKDILVLVYSTEKLYSHLSTLAILHGSKATAVSLLLPLSQLRAETGSGHVYSLSGSQSRASLVKNTMARVAAAADRKNWTKFDIELQSKNGTYELGIVLLLNYDTGNAAFEVLVCSFQSCIALGNAKLHDYDPLEKNEFWLMTYIGNGYDFRESDPAAAKTRWSVTLRREVSRCYILNKEGQRICPDRAMGALQVCALSAGTNDTLVNDER